MKNQYEIDYQQGYDNANEEWLDRIDKIRAEIEQIELLARYTRGDIKQMALDVIDKCKTESEVGESGVEE